MLKKIEIKHEFSFNELCSRLKNVKLRGFPDVRIYRDANMRISCPPVMSLFTPQPCVYTPILNRVRELSDFFSEKGIDIFNLTGGVDYLATDEKHEVTEWTLIPPVVEVVPIKFNSDKGLDYSRSLAPELVSLMKEKGYELNPELKNLDYPEYEQFKGQTALIPIICDGSHRVEVGEQRKGLQTMVLVTSPQRGFPYYAAPKPYSSVHEELNSEKSDKTHVLTSPGHKLLYRVFPSGGIQNGNVRPPTSKETYV